MKNQGNQHMPLITKRCKECNELFTNNGRNAKKDKDFCTSYCSSKNHTREYRKKLRELDRKIFEACKQDVLTHVKELSQ